MLEAVKVGILPITCYEVIVVCILRKMEVLNARVYWYHRSLHRSRRSHSAVCRDSPENGQAELGHLEHVVGDACHHPHKSDRGGKDRPMGNARGSWWNYRDRKSTRLNSSHSQISYAVFCLKKKK